MKYNVIELFSGIGSQARALQNIGIKINVQATCEWDIHALIAYDCIHNSNIQNEQIQQMSKEELIKTLSRYVLSNNGKEPMKFSILKSYNVEMLRKIYTAIVRNNNLVDISSVSGADMPQKTDVLTYSFPCQDLSNVGAFHHYTKGIDKDSGSRSSLLWQVGRILSEMRMCGKNLPRFLVMENVPTLLSARHKPNFDMWKRDLEELGYISKEFLLNAKDFGLPQNRPRLLMLSVSVGDDTDKRSKVEQYFTRTTEQLILSNYKRSRFYQENSILDLLRIPKIKGDQLWKEAVMCTPNDTPSRRKIWEENPKIIDDKGIFCGDKFIRTITTKQDRHPNSGNVYFDSSIEGKSSFRYLTPRECLLFMGFTDGDYEKLIQNNIVQSSHGLLFPRDKIYRMAGNSIPVKLLEGFFYQLYSLEKILR